MQPLSILANLLLTVTIGTLMVALIAYMAYKMREKRRPRNRANAPGADDSELVFLRPYVMHPAIAGQDGDPGPDAVRRT